MLTSCDSHPYLNYGHLKSSVTLAVSATKEYQKSEIFIEEADISQDTKICLFKEEPFAHIV
ncbi:MAG: hypothetical protein D4R50_00515 [Actinomycetales bacterium]|nr:MAG: hypothetical protein D4R50_00515 [Actinomycetales bacterium]